MDARIATNQELWDSRVAAHLSSKFYDMDGFRAGRCSLQALDRELMGPVEGLSLLHLQCHFGQDTLSWARRGALVSGVDLSERAVQTAIELAAELGIPARFHAANVLEYQPDRSYDRVYTSYGVLGWLPDLKPWARLVASALKPGGRFVLVEFHPLLLMHCFSSGELRYEYFHQGSFETVKGSYADIEDQTERGEYFWSHSLADVIGSLLEQGLRLEQFQEIDWSPYACFENMAEQAPGQYVFSPGKVRLPHLFALSLLKPDQSHSCAG
jgi:SAM-dependent methyltransferase